MLEVITPLAWPNPPDTYSFSALAGISSCPRQWAYKHARYEPGGLASDRGILMGRASWGAARGEIIHETLEHLLNVHSANGGPPARHWGLVAFWRQHLPPGGIPSLTASITARVLEARTAHSRSRALRPALRRVAAENNASMAASVSKKLEFALVVTGGRRDGSGAVGGRRTLPPGASAEVGLRCTLEGPLGRAAWRGDADIIKLVNGAIEIIDYKTGEPKPEHRRQLEIYALLLWRDEEINPQRLRASRLTLVYENGKKETWSAPTVEAQRALEAELVQECRAAEASLANQPPPARVGEACRWCEAKPICGDYWALSRPIAAASAPRADLALLVTSLTRDRAEMAGTDGSESARFLLAASLSAAVSGLMPGDTVRVIGAKPIPVAVDEGQPPTGRVFELDAVAEVIKLPSPAGR